MKKWLKALLTFTFFMHLATLLDAQSKVDSLVSLLNIHPEDDTIRVNLLLDLSKNLYGSNPDQAIKYAEEAKTISIKLNYPHGIGYALKNIGLAYYGRNFPEVLINWEASLKVFIESNDKLGEANILNNIGAVYFVQGDYVHALNYYLKSLSLSEELKDTIRIATALGNIGSVYENDPNTYDKSLEYYLKAIQLCEKTGDLGAIASAAVNLGQIYLQMKKYDNALIYFIKAEENYRTSGLGHQYLPVAIASIGNVYTLKGNYSLAIKYQTEALDLSRELDLPLREMQSQIYLGETYNVFKNTPLSIKSYLEAEKLAIKTGSKFELKKIYDALSSIYAGLKDYNKAYDYSRLLNETKDSLYTDDTVKKLGLLQFEFDLEKKESQISLLTKDKELQDLELKRQRVSKNALIGGVILLTLLGFFLFRNYQIKDKANKMLAQQNTEILQQKKEIESQKDDIESQKGEIENLILNILPVEVAQELRKTGSATPRYHESVSVLFTDFKEFSKMAEALSAQNLVAELNKCFIAFDDIIEKHGLEKIKTIGDAYMCACGIPTAVPDHTLRTVRAALDIQKYIIIQNEQRIAQGDKPWELRIGVHTGPVIAGVVGRKKFAYDIWGNAVNIAARLEANGAEGKVNISDAAYQVVRRHYSCTYRGKINAKNIGDIDMYYVDKELVSQEKTPVEV